MRTVIGVDPSLSRTGVAVWRDGAVSTLSIPTTRQDGPRVVRERIICGRIMPLIGGLGRTVAIVEAVHMSRLQRGRTALDLAGLHDVIVYGLHARGVTVGVASPQCAKVIATGNGAASKARMLEAAEQQFAITVANTDEADAAWLMAAGVVAGGGQVRGWPTLFDQARADTLKKIDWIGSYPPDWLTDR